jgi:hypothetical protein
MLGCKKLAEKGITVKQLKELKFNDTEYIDLSYENNEAGILIIHNGVGQILNKEANELFKEMSKLKYDTKALMRGKVVNKIARWNNCIADFSQEADYENGKGTIIDFREVPLLNDIRDYFEEIFDVSLLAETNLYYNVKKNYIGFHGDSERRIVIGIRLGEEFPLYYQWYKDSNPVGSIIKIDNISHGDIYIMSEKAVGFDWKKRSIYTLRHAAGYEETLKIKKDDGQLKVKEKDKEKKDDHLCQGVKKDGHPCTNKAKYGNFCGIHIKTEQNDKKTTSPRKNSKESTKKATSPRKSVRKQDDICKGIKKNGERCTNKAKYDSYCGIHKK